MGKTISIYLDDNLFKMVESSGKNPSKIVQEALKKYFLPDNRKQAFNEFAVAAKALGKTLNFKQVIQDWENDRENDRW